VLRDIQSNRGSLSHGRLLWWQLDTVTLARRCRWGVHPIRHTGAAPMNNRLPKNDMARVIVAVLYNMKTLPRAAHPEVVYREQNSSEESLARLHKLAVDAKNSVAARSKPAMTRLAVAWLFGHRRSAKLGRALLPRLKGTHDPAATKGPLISS
jgi:hypothetical protein